jgi:hypothetical protein
MMITVLLFGLPWLYAASLIRLVVSSDRTGLLPSIGIAVATGVVAIWSIQQSRSSTAAIGLIFIPMLAAASGCLALPHGRWRRAPEPALRVLGLVLLLLAFVPMVMEAVAGRRTIERNAERDADAAQRERVVQGYRAEIDRVVALRGGDAASYVDSLIRARRDDRELMLAALESHRVSPALLDSLAGSPDLGIALEAVRNDSIPSTALARVYHTAATPYYFFQALAANPHTPHDILRAIRATQPPPVSGLDIWFAENVAAPPDLLLDIARTSESIDAIRVLLRNPSIACAVVDAAAVGPASARGADEALRAQVSDARAAHC